MSTIASVLLIFSCIQLISCKKDIFCQPSKHEFYVKQIGRCKKCDRCPPGFGYSDYNKNRVDMDPVHGAVSCLSCLPCLPGVTFSKFISFKPCRPCKDCAKQGKRELRLCTTKRNRKCVKPPKRQLTTENEQTKTRIIPTIASPIEAKEDNFFDFKNTFLVTTVVIVVIATVLVSVTIVVKVRRQKHVRNVATSLTQEQHNSLTNDEYYQGQTASREIEMVVMESEIGTSFHAVGPLQRNTTLSFPSDLECELNTLPLRHCDLDADGDNDQMERDTSAMFNPVDDIKGNQQMSDIDIQHISYHIAANNLYKHIGTFLGVPNIEIQILEEENRNNLKEVAFQTLKKWQEIKGKKATKSELQKALRSLKGIDLMDKIS